MSGQHRSLAASSFFAAGETLEAAEVYTRDGWHLFPSSPSKIPLVKWGSEATTDMEAIRAWVKRWPDMMLCCACAPSGLVVLDLDVKAEPRGDVWLMEQVRDRGPIPWTRQQVTGSGGTHFIFKAPPGVAICNSQKKIHPSVDVRGNGGGMGGMFVLAPSVAKAGPYQMVQDGAPQATLSGWLLDLMLASSKVDEPVAPTRIDGRWGRDLEHRARRALAYVEKCPPAISGSNGHDTTFRVALALVRGFELPTDAALEVLRFYNASCHPAWRDCDLLHKIHDAERSTVASGYLLERGAA